MRFFKVYEKSTCGIFLIFGYFLKLATTTFFGKSCAGNASDDVPSVSREVTDGKSGSGQILRRPITKIVLLVENHFDSSMK